MEYLGPKMVIKKKHFSKDLVSKGGFEKVTYFKCFDGDTAVFRFKGNRENVRFLVINAPELEPIEKPFAKEAKEYLEKTLSNAKEIYLQSDKFSALRDNTERRRLLCWVWADGELVNFNLVRLGLAEIKYVYSPNLSYLNSLEAAQILARLEHLGMYQEENNVLNS